MSAFLLRSCLYVGDNSISVCSRWKPYTRKLQQPGLQLPYLLKSTLKTSKWNQSRWPGRRNLVNSVENVGQNHYALSRLWKPFAFTLAVSGTSLVVAAIVQYENLRSHAVQARRRWGEFHTVKYGQFRQHLHSWWHNLSAGDKTFVPICAINVLVFLAWKVPAWQPIMGKYFVAGLASGTLCWPMLLSVFSHYSILHLAANMFVLHSFSDRAVNTLGKEQFVGMYLSAGMVASFTSYLFKAIIKSSSSSLGAGLKAILCMDTAGCIFRWSFFDHAAHLGGSLFGIAWHYFGQEFIWQKRAPLIWQFWHEIRGPVK